VKTTVEAFTLPRRFPTSADITSALTRADSRQHG
jgi:hypothetical protein